jgi:hypothetical protein
MGTLNAAPVGSKARAAFTVYGLLGHQGLCCSRAIDRMRKRCEGTLALHKFSERRTRVCVVVIIVVVGK